MAERCKHVAPNYNWGRRTRCQKTAKADGYCVEHHLDAAVDRIRGVPLKPKGSAEYVAAVSAASAERALVDAALAWIAHQDEHGCHGNHAPTLDALRAAARAVREARGA